MMLRSILFVAAFAASVVAQEVRIEPADPLGLRRGIESAIAGGAKKIVVPPGVYRLEPARGRVCLRIADVSDVEIDATGATLLLADPASSAIEFFRCRRVTLRGLIIENETPPFTQGTITGIDPQGLWIDLTIDAGYPAGLDDPKRFIPGPAGYVFDRQARRIKAGTYDHYLKSVERRGEGAFRLHLPRAIRPAEQSIVVGDAMGFRGIGGSAIRVAECESMRIENVTLRAAGGFGIHDAGGEGGNHYNYRVTFGPRPAGASTDPLIACVADAFHSSGTRRGPTLENCFFEGMCDDGVPIHGYYAMIVEARGRELAFQGPWEMNFFRAGDALRLFDEAGALVGEATVVQSGPAEGYKAAEPLKDKHYANLKRYHRLTLDRELPAKRGQRISTPAANGSGFVIRNCTIRNHRARGLLIKADNGLIENNTIEGSTIAGLIIAPEYWWNEACYGRNIIIRNNTFKGCGYATNGAWDSRPGTVSLAGEGGGRGIVHGNQKIVIVGNRFVENDGVNLLVHGSQEVTIRDNQFVRSHRQPTRRGADRGFDGQTLVWLANCEDVNLNGNRIIEPGEHIKTLIKVGENAKRIGGLEDGVRP